MRRLLFLVALCVLWVGASDARAAVWSSVDSCGAVNDGLGSSLSTTDTCATVNAGDVVVCGVYGGGTTAITSVTDSGNSETFTQIPQGPATSGTTRLSIYYTLSATVTGTVTYKVNYASGSATTRRIRCDVLRAASGTPALEASNANSGTSTTLSTGSISPSGSTDLYVVAFARFAAAAAQANHEIDGNTSVSAGDSGGGVYKWQLADYGSFTDDATATNASSTAYTAAIIAIRSATVGGGAGCGNNLLLLGAGGAPCE